jgi:hypothetical protein
MSGNCSKLHSVKKARGQGIMASRPEKLPAALAFPKAREARAPSGDSSGGRSFVDSIIA